MAVTAVFDTQNRLERYIRDDTPEAYRTALLAGTTKVVKTKSAQLVITDELNRRASILLDNLQERPVMIIEADDWVMITAHDLVRIQQFFTKVVEEL